MRYQPKRAARSAAPRECTTRERLGAFDLAAVAALCMATVFMLADIVTNTSAAEEKFEFYIYFQEPEEFLAEHFGPDVPAPQVLTLDSGKQQQVREVFTRPFPKPRLRYWTDGARTAWIFDDVGKEGYQPTTCGFVVKDGEIVAARVLTYRESRGEEVGEPSFLNQLIGGRAEGKGLDQPIDNITGATRSVEMMERMARTAIVFDQLVP
ncbi:FMN-binding protein [Algiphilus sp.]|uniref:FMN-binding protein n=1 Tax=Algiphilus sp. TaxID=1872431 RepID=UPI003C429BC1